MPRFSNFYNDDESEEGHQEDSLYYSAGRVPNRCGGSPWCLWVVLVAVVPFHTVHRMVYRTVYQEGCCYVTFPSAGGGVCGSTVCGQWLPLNPQEEVPGQNVWH